MNLIKVIYKQYADMFVAVFPELPANNIAANVLVYSRDWGFVGLSESEIRCRLHNAIKDERFYEFVALVESIMLTKSCRLKRSKRLLRRYKLARHTALYAADKTRSEELKTLKNTI